MTENLEAVLGQVRGLDKEAMDRARERWNQVAKPLHSLGILEDMVVRIAGIQGTSRVRLGRRVLYEICADNGVVAQGVSQCGSEVTALVAENFLKGETCSAIMAKRAGADLMPVDLGMARDTRVRRDLKVRYGTADMSQGPAMSREEAVRAVLAGVSLAEEAREAGYDLLLLGEMGIGNTSTSSAVASVLLGERIEEMVGRGAGLSREGLGRKARVLREAIEKNRPDPEDVLDVLSRVGGLDLCCLAGLCLGGAVFHLPVLLDGFITCVAALCAVRLHEGVAGYLLPSHASHEPGTARVVGALGLNPLLYGRFCLGEGTGALCLLPMLDMALEIYERMSSFSEISLAAYEEYE